MRGLVRGAIQRQVPKHPHKPSSHVRGARIRGIDSDLYIYHTKVVRSDADMMLSRTKRSNDILSKTVLSGRERGYTSSSKPAKV